MRSRLLNVVGSLLLFTCWAPSVAAPSPTADAHASKTTSVPAAKGSARPQSGVRKKRQVRSQSGRKVSAGPVRFNPMWDEQTILDNFNAIPPAPADGHIWRNSGSADYMTGRAGAVDYTKASAGPIDYTKGSAGLVDYTADDSGPESLPVVASPASAFGKDRPGVQDAQSILEKFNAVPAGAPLWEGPDPWLLPDAERVTVWPGNSAAAELPGVLAGDNAAEKEYRRALKYGAQGEWLKCANSLQRAADLIGQAADSSIAGETQTSLYKRAVNVLVMKGLVSKNAGVRRGYFLAANGKLRFLIKREPGNAQWHWWLAHSLADEGKVDQNALKEAARELEGCVSAVGPQKYVRMAPAQLALVRDRVLQVQSAQNAQPLVPIKTADIPDKSWRGYNNLNMAAANNAYGQGDWAATQRILAGWASDVDKQRYF